jgi:hypothetical protein
VGSPNPRLSFDSRAFSSHNDGQPANPRLNSSEIPAANFQHKTRDICTPTDTCFCLCYMPRIATGRTDLANVADQCKQCINMDSASDTAGLEAQQAPPTALLDPARDSQSASGVAPPSYDVPNGHTCSTAGFLTGYTDIQSLSLQHDTGLLAADCPTDPHTDIHSVFPCYCVDCEPGERGLRLEIQSDATNSTAITALHTGWPLASFSNPIDDFTTDRKSVV